MGIFRFLGWALVLVGVVLLARDAADALREHGHFAPISFGSFVERYGVAQVTEAIWRFLTVEICRPVYDALAYCWAFVVLLVAGSLILFGRGGLSFGRRRR
jgi:hypothetical protein